MGKYFGTDGVRGVAGADLTCEMAMLIGRGAAAVLTSSTGHKPRILIGKDTRQSGDMLEAALTAGLCSVGADVESLGVVPTPAVAYLVRKYNADAGVVISASHNPMEFNGIKIFAGTGYKLPDDVEEEIEAHIDDKCAGIPLATGDGVGRVTCRIDGIKDYVEHLYESIGGDLSGLNVCIDCANGASAEVARQLFPRLGAKCTFLGVSPDGRNINAGVGSTHLDNLEKAVVEGGFDCGIAFDGDKIIALLAMAMKDKGRLDGNTAVVTVMSNLGFVKYMESQGINTEKTAVGDRYVLENMRENGYAIGGEQSGHVILLHHATTGDGELTAGKLLRLLAESGKKMSELNGIYAQYPQVLVNVVANAAQKAAYKADEVLAGFIENEEQKLMGMGRVLVRVSGTEPKIRVMVEGQDLEAIDCCAKRIVEKINKRILEGLEG